MEVIYFIMTLLMTIMSEYFKTFLLRYDSTLLIYIQYLMLAYLKTT